jgi:xanthine permease
VQSRYDERTLTSSADANEGMVAAHPPNGSVVTSAIDPVEAHVGLPKMLTFGLQHVLVMYAGTVAVPLILGSALHLTPVQVVALISADLFTSGLATLLQTLGWGNFGARLPLIQGCSFVFVAPMILIGSSYGISTMYGAVICCGLFMIVAGPVYSRLLRFFPPVVIGSVIVVIGLTLIPVAGGWLGGGDAKAADFGSFRNLGLGLATIAMVVLVQRFGRGMIANLGVLMGLLGGTALAAAMGKAGFAQVASTPWFALTRPLMFGRPHFALLPGVVMSIATLVVMTETTGNCLAIGEITGRRIGRGTLSAAFRADGLSTMLGGVFNSFPYNAYSQNVGLLSLSGMKSRFAVAAGGGILVTLGFLPKLAAVIAGVPRPVLGGAALVMFGMTAMAGVEELTHVRFKDTNNALVVAISIATGVLPIAAPGLFAHAPEEARLFLNSGIFLAAGAAILLNVVFNDLRGSEAKNGV